MHYFHFRIQNGRLLSSCIASCRSAKHFSFLVCGLEMTWVNIGDFEWIPSENQYGLLGTILLMVYLKGEGKVPEVFLLVTVKESTKFILSHEGLVLKFTGQSYRPLSAIASSVILECPLYQWPAHFMQLGRRFTENYNNQWCPIFRKTFETWNVQKSDTIFSLGNT